jgi:MFS family permease
MFGRAYRFLAGFGRDLWILTLGWFVGALGFSASIPFISIYFHAQLGLSTIEIGMFFGAQAVVRAGFQAVGGEMADRVGRNVLLVNAQIARAVSFLLIALAITFDSGFWMIAALVTINSIFGSIFMPAVNALVSDIVPPERRLDGYAVSRAAENLGWAAGPAIGGFLAHSSYSVLFYMSAAITLASALIFWLFFKAPVQTRPKEAFKLSDLLDLKKDRHLAHYAILTFMLYLVVAQLIAPFSVYSVEMIGISEARLGLLLTINGLMVALLQIPVTRILRGYRLTTQLAAGAVLYALGYGAMGFFPQYGAFVILIMIVTLGEVVMSPPSVTLISRLAPEGRMGRYMGVYGFFVTAGWSFGPLYGGFFLDRFATQPELAWVLISSLAVVAAVGYVWFGRRLEGHFNGGAQPGRST